MPWLEREVAVARFLARAGAPVVPPWFNPGPYVADGLEVSLWQYAEHEPGGVAPAVFGALLGELHAALAPYEGPLRPLAGPLTDISLALRLSRDAVLHCAPANCCRLPWRGRAAHCTATHIRANCY